MVVTFGQRMSRFLAIVTIVVIVILDFCTFQQLLHHGLETLHRLLNGVEPHICLLQCRVVAFEIGDGIDPGASFGPVVAFGCYSFVFCFRAAIWEFLFELVGR